MKIQKWTPSAMGMKIAIIAFALIRCCSQSAGLWGSIWPARRYAGGPVSSCLATRAQERFWFSAVTETDV